MGNAASTPQASCGHISIVLSILSASPCAVPTPSHMDWCLSELRIRIFSRTIPKCCSRTVYSVSFVFGQLRYRARSLHSSGKAAADACRSPKTAGSCAKCCAIAQARHRCGRFRGYHAPRLSAALPGWRASAALGSRFLRERPTNHARYLHQLLLTAGCALYGVQILVLHRRREVCCRGCLSSNLAANEE